MSIIIFSLLPSFLLATVVMAAGGRLHTNSATAEVTLVSNSDAVRAYWHKMLPNAPMPPAIIELLTPPAGIVHDIERRNTNNGETNNVEKSRFIWGPSTKNDIHRFIWGPSTKNDIHGFIWGPSAGDGDQKGNQKGASLGEIGDSHIGGSNQKHGTMSNIVFLEEALKPGSTINYYILPSSTSGAPLLRRDVADSIPMSTRNFTDILAMFAPTSNGMAADIWWTLELCEHTRPIKGETKTCATSVESMVEFSASVLQVSTYNLRAFSSPDVPAEGIMSGRGYKVTATRRVTEAGNTITCHGERFPFAMFMCHAVNPTRVYSVMLEREDIGAGGVGQRMEALAVCHLDTSSFDPAKMPVHVKPGDAPLCHFMSRDNILWAPARARA